MAPGRQTRCNCTLPFSLHLTVMILGIKGFIFTVIITALVFQNPDSFKGSNGSDASVKGAVVWLLLTTILIFASGLQGLLLLHRNHHGGFWRGCHIVLAVINLVNLGVLIVTVIFSGSAFWIIYMVAVFVMELWATALQTCCKKRQEVGSGGVGMTDIPTANSYAVDIPPSERPAYKVDPAGGPYPGTNSQFEQLR